MFSPELLGFPRFLYQNAFPMFKRTPAQVRADLGVLRKSYRFNPLRFGCKLFVMVVTLPMIMPFLPVMGLVDGILLITVNLRRFRLKSVLLGTVLCGAFLYVLDQWLQFCLRAEMLSFIVIPSSISCLLCVLVLIERGSRMRERYCGIGPIKWGRQIIQPFRMMD